MDEWYICLDWVFKLVLFVWGDFDGIWDIFVRDWGIEYLGIRVELDGVVGICWWLVEVNGKFGE